MIVLSVNQKNEKECAWRESNPRPLVHKTSALPIELQSLRLKIYNNGFAKNDDMNNLM